MAAFLRLVLVFCCCFTMGLSLKAEAASKAVFAIVDQGGYVDAISAKEWHMLTKATYRYPWYNLVADNTDVATAVAGKKVQPEALAALAKAKEAQALIIVKVHELNETLVHSFSLFHDFDEPLVRVTTAADIYIYQANSGRLLKKRLRDHDLKEPGSYEAPAIVVKWELQRLLRQMKALEEENKK